MAPSPHLPTGLHGEVRSLKARRNTASGGMVLNWSLRRQNSHAPHEPGWHPAPDEGYQGDSGEIHGRFLDKVWVVCQCEGS